MLTTVFVTLGIVGATAWRPLPSRRVEIGMTAMRFKPEVLTISVGDTVVWKNLDIVIHSAEGAKGAFDSGDLRSGEYYAWVASEPGEYAYKCSSHRRMRGKIIVRK